MLSGATTLVVPCFNEERRLATGLFLSFLNTHPHISLLFVDDGSTDATAAMLASMERMAADGRCEVLRLPENVGKAEAVRRGMLRAAHSSSCVGFLDADLATPLEEMPKLLAVFPSHPDCLAVLGSRAPLSGHVIHRRASRRTFGRAFLLLLRTLLRLDIYDSQCGAKLFRVTPLFLSILQEPFKTRWLFDLEILLRLRAGTSSEAGYAFAQHVIEYPLEQWEDKPESKFRIRDLFALPFAVLTLLSEQRRLSRVRMHPATEETRA